MHFRICIVNSILWQCMIFSCFDRAEIILCPLRKFFGQKHLLRIARLPEDSRTRRARSLCTSGRTLCRTRFNPGRTCFGSRMVVEVSLSIPFYYCCGGAGLKTFNSMQFILHELLWVWHAVGTPINYTSMTNKVRDSDTRRHMLCPTHF
jgi:hypothetical protein